MVDGLAAEQSRGAGRGAGAVGDDSQLSSRGELTRGPGCSVEQDEGGGSPTVDLVRDPVSSSIDRVLPQQRATYASVGGRRSPWRGG